MRLAHIPLLALIPLLLSACHVFLGPEPDSSPEAVLYGLWKDFNDMHAYLDFRMSHNKKYNNWDDVYYNQSNGYRTQLQRIAYVTDARLFGLCVNMLKELDDAHVSLRTPDNPWFSIGGIGSLDYEKIRDSLDEGGNDQYINFLYGTFKPETDSEPKSDSKPKIGYIHIRGFTNPYSSPGDTQEWAEKVNDVIQSMGDTAAIVLDVRCNGGGDPWAMEYIAGRFAAKAKDYMWESVKNGPGPYDFSKPQLRMVKPAGTRYTKPILLLTNEDSVSAAEWFTLALRTQDHIIHAGMTTHGAFSGRVDRPMVNGWIYRISPYRITDINGNCYEGIGISPDAEYMMEDTAEKQLINARDLAYEMAGAGN